MNRELRNALRETIDQAARAQIDWDAEPRCRSCGTELANETLGCGTCWDRRRGRTRRGSPELSPPRLAAKGPPLSMKAGTLFQLVLPIAD